MIGANAAALAGGIDGAQNATLSATPASDSFIIAARVAVMATGSASATEGSGFTEIDDVTRNDYEALHIQTRTGLTITTVPWADVNAGAGVIFENFLMALEIKAAAGAADVLMPQICL
mgnify:CR=1 FL=1